LDSQPREIEAMKAQELEHLNQELQQVGKEFCRHLDEDVNLAVNNACPTFEADFRHKRSPLIPLALLRRRGIFVFFQPLLYQFPEHLAHIASL
jgi:hypothetical protein